MHTKEEITFDHKTIQQIGHYVYALLDEKRLPFYIGKGQGNRVFDHVNCRLDESVDSAKYGTINELKQSDTGVEHIIIRHGLTEKEAFEVEAALIDLERFRDKKLTNIQSGHRSLENGLMTANEIRNKYNAQPLSELKHPVVIININKTYKRGSGAKGIYEATRGNWVIAESRTKTIQYALSEYRGLVVEVFKIQAWSEVHQKKKDGKTQIRRCFTAIVAEDSVRKLYINKSIKDAKKRGQSNPIRYTLA